MIYIITILILQSIVIWNFDDRKNILMLLVKVRPARMRVEVRRDTNRVHT